MKYLAYYIDAPAESRVIEAETAEKAGWLFVQLRPRTDASQLTVEPTMAGEDITHYRACDLLHAKMPDDEGEPFLILRTESGRELHRMISGTIESLRLLEARLRRGLDEFSGRAPSEGNRSLCEVRLFPDDGGGREEYLSFSVDLDPGRHRPLVNSLRARIARAGSLLSLTGLAILAVVGFVTVVRQIF